MAMRHGFRNQSNPYVHLDRQARCFEIPDLDAEFQRDTQRIRSRRHEQMNRTRGRRPETGRTDPQAPRIAASTLEPEPRELPWSLLFKQRRLGGTLFFFAIVSLILSSRYGFIGWVPTLLLHRGQSIVHSLTHAAVMATGASIGMLLPIFLLDRVGRRTMVACASFGAAAIGIGYAFALDAQAWVLMLTGFCEILCVQVTANTVLAVYLPELFQPMSGAPASARQPPSVACRRQSCRISCWPC